MDLQLKSYQTDAARAILTALGYAREDWHSPRRRRTAFSLSSTTGSGKTVIAAAVIEAMLRGSAEFDVERDESAVFLWVSKDPSLNVQTRRRFLRYLPDVSSSDFIVLDETYRDRSLKSGRVYFINPDKLRQGSRFVKHTETRNYTFWEILKNTIDDPEKTLYMVLDEAHEGMKATTEAERSIVQRIINGNGVNPAVPIVLGVSATVKRFNDAMASADDFDKVKNVTVPVKEVQESGLLKNSLTLEIPDEEARELGMPLVKGAAEDFADVSALWEHYCETEGADPVDPLLVVLVPNRESGQSNTAKGLAQEDAFIKAVLDNVRKGWPGMPDGCVAHVLDRGEIQAGPYTVPKVKAEDVDDQRWIRVLVGKQTIATGWDCPRAEVLVSLRSSAKQEDTTHVTQLLGRMVRTPLAQETNVERLNAVSCYLPYFDKETAKRVAEELMGLREPASGEPTSVVSKVLLKPVTLVRNPDVEAGVVELIESLPSYLKPSRAPKPIKRMLAAAQALSQDKIVEDALNTARESAYDALDVVMDDHADEVDAMVEQILTASIERLLATRGSEEIESERGVRPADETTVVEAFKRVRRLVGNEIAIGYLSRLVVANGNNGDSDDGDLFDTTRIKARVAALAFIDADVKGAVEDVADALTRMWLTTKAKEIAKVSDLRRPVYDRLDDGAREPEPTVIEVKHEDIVDSVDPNRNPLPRMRLHVLSMPDGDYPLPYDVSRNDWEKAVIAKESAASTLVGWYRNPSHARKDALRVVHRPGEEWKSTQPDFVFVHEIGGVLKASLVDPHGIQDSGAGPRLKGLAQYADEHRDAFDRIIAVGVKVNGALYGLDLKNAAVRAAVQAAHGDRPSLDQVFDKHGVKYTDV